jgi:N-acyl homoserine lactone hydrolase
MRRASKAEHPVTKLEGDKDVFGDGSVTIIAPPGHTLDRSRRERRCRAWRISWTKERATPWINHDKAQRDTLKMAPEYYE